MLREEDEALVPRDLRKSRERKQEERRTRGRERKRKERGTGGARDGFGGFGLKLAA